MAGRLLYPAIEAGVLIVGASGDFDLASLMGLAETSIAYLPPTGPGYDALVLDLASVERVHLGASSVVGVWLEYMANARPHVIVCRADALGFWRHVALQLTNRPALVDVYHDFDAGVQWARVIGVTCRFERARRLGR